MILSLLLFVSSPQISIPSTVPIPVREQIALPPKPFVDFPDRLCLVKKTLRGVKRKKFAGTRLPNGGLWASVMVDTEVFWLN